MIKPEKVLLTGDEARKRLAEGISTLARAVTTTYGPQGRTVLMEQEWAPPGFTRDGVTVARQVEIEDALASLGAQLLRYAAIRTAEVAGDGTTTAILLTEAIVQEGMRVLSTGMHPQELIDALDEAFQRVFERLEAWRLPPTPERIRAVATVAARDPQVGKWIQEALEQAGIRGEVIIETGKEVRTRMEVLRYHAFQTAGYHKYLAPPDYDTLWEQSRIVLAERLSSSQPLRALVATGEPILFIGRMEEGVRAFMEQLKQRGYPLTAAFPPGKSMGHGEALEGFMQDVAVLTGGEPYGGFGAIRAGSAQVHFLGDEIRLAHVGGEQAAIDAHREYLRQRLKEETSSHARIILKKRLQFLAQPLVRIVIGGISQAEIEEQAYLYEDALLAAKSAQEQGVLFGSGKVLFLLSQTLDPQHVGERILAHALMQPIRKLIENAGYSVGRVLDYLQRVEPPIGWDLMSDRPIHLEEAGILDAYRAVEMALRSAQDVATAILMADTIMAEAVNFWR